MSPRTAVDETKRQLSDCETALVHLEDDFERLRTSVLRLAETDSIMLYDAIHALDHGRFPVVREFLERVRDHLDAQAKAMKEARRVAS